VGPSVIDRAGGVGEVLGREKASEVRHDIGL
jgi:hypothetical protein